MAGQRLYFRIKSYLSDHGHRLLFGLSFISLVALLAWWSVFIQRSITRQHDLELQLLRSKLEHYSLILGQEKKQRPMLGLLREDDRYEIVKKGYSLKADSLVLSPYWSEYYVRLRSSVVDKIEHKYSRLKFMLHGEGGLLFLIILVSIFFLYRHIQLERKTRKEVKEFWERSAHEIKTPITGIKALLQNLKGQKGLKEYYPYIDMALGQVREQEKMAENIISGYRSEAKDIKLNIQSLELVRFLSKYFKCSAIQLAESIIDIDYDQGVNIKVLGDAHALRVILDNLLDNAYKYCSPHLHLSIRIISKKNKIVIVVKDNGPGFKQDQIKKIFQAYKYTSDEFPLGRRGTGLGLYLSRQLAKKMRGDLKAYSRGEGKGSEFHIFLQQV